MNEILEKFYLEFKGAWRFRWLAMSVAWIASVIGWTIVYMLPDVYESEATVYVDTNSALRPLLASLTVDADVLGQVDQVTRAMMGRPYLEKVARDTRLHLRAQSDNELSKLIVGMRQRIGIQNNPRLEPNVYKISFNDTDPYMAQAVVESLLKSLVEDSLGANQLDTENAQEFVRGQLEKLEVELTLSENELANFKKQNVGRMPGEGGGYFARLQAEMNALDSVSSNLKLAMRRHDSLQQQLTGEQPTIDFSNGPQSEIDQRIATNRSKLEELQIRFTDAHPDVISLKQTLNQLEERRRLQLDELREKGGLGVASDNPVFQNIQIELTNVVVEIAALNEQDSTLSSRISELQELIDVLPEVEAQLARLTRDYDVKQRQYQSLLERLEVSELSESAEQSGDAKFRVIDPPYLPGNPSAPDRTLLLFIALAVGLGFGSAIAFLRNLSRPVFNDISSLRRTIGLPVLGSVHGVTSPVLQKRRRVELSAFSALLLVLGLAFVLVLLFQASGGEYVRSLV